MKEIKTFIKQNPKCQMYLPIEKEWDKLPKQFICNVIYTTVGEPFASWVKERILERNTTIVKEKNLAIEMDPEVLAAFKSSTAVSRKLLPNSSSSSYRLIHHFQNCSF